MLQEKLEALQERTHALAEDGKLTFETVPDDPLAYITVLASGSILVDAVDNDGAPPYRLSVVRNDSDGLEVLASISQEYDANGLWSYPLLARLYELARADALGVTPVIDGLLSELGALEESPDTLEGEESRE